MRQQPLRLSWSACRLAPLACAFAVSAGTAAQSDLRWGVQERAARGCVREAQLEFHAVGALGGHPPQPLCGSTAVRMYPAPLPTGVLTISFSNSSGERRRYDVPLDAVFRREGVRIDQTVLEVVYGQDSVELWTRPLPAAAGGPPAAFDGATPKRIYLGGLELDTTPPRPGISRSRAP